MAMNNKLLTLEQVAEHLGVHRDTVYKLVRSGRLPALQLGGRKAGWRVAEDDLRQFIDEGKSATSEAIGRKDDSDLMEFDATQVRDLEDFRRFQAEQRQSFFRHD